MERDRSEILSIAKTTMMQLLEVTPPDVFLSWGADRFRAVWSHSQPTLAFSVRGLVFTGTVEIGLDEGADLYDIRMCRDGADVGTVEGVYFDQLGDVVDSLVEKPADEPDEAYWQRLEKHYGSDMTGRQ